MKYDRNFLVPYLQSVYNTEFALQSMISQHKKVSIDLQSKNAWQNDNIMFMVDPVPPTIEQFHKSYGYCLKKGYNWFFWMEIKVLYKLFLFTVSLFPAAFVMRPIFYIMRHFSSSAVTFLGICLWLFVSYSIIALLYGTYLYLDQGDREMLQDARKHYEHAHKMHLQFKQYDNIMERNKKQLGALTTEIDKLKIMREKVYEPNVIPKPFRSLPFAYFLYDYFSSSQADDLDMIIQTAMLNNIQAELKTIQNKLNNIIQNQYEMVNQLDEICTRARTIEAQNYEQLKALAQMEENQQLQNSYLQMIAADASASAYFSETTCLIALKNDL
ncbi:MAG: hypothetical protein Q4C48_11075 [Lachnospiraceae bacterium]|nr:hypothetical protein [Lachnospiraceae bacterium]